MKIRAPMANLIRGNGMPMMTARCTATITTRHMDMGMTIHTIMDTLMTILIATITPIPTTHSTL